MVFLRGGLQGVTHAIDLNVLLHNQSGMLLISPLHFVGVLLISPLHRCFHGLHLLPTFGELMLQCLARSQLELELHLRSVQQDAIPLFLVVSLRLLG